MILFVDACVRKDSRTLRLAEHLLNTLGEPYERLRLADCSFPAADEKFLTERDRLIYEGNFTAPLFEYAARFARADAIVIAAPFWDLSFPALLKVYLEQVNVIGLTFRYTQEGIPEGLCRADTLYYVTTAGGEGFPEDYGFGSVDALAKKFYGIGNTELIKATGLDIDGAQTERILLECEKDITERFGKKQ